MHLQEKRKIALINGFMGTFHTQPTRFFSSPGRMEMMGNHTDHNHGLALAAAIDLDIFAATKPNDLGLIRAISNGFPALIEINLDELEPIKKEQGTSTSLIRGVASRIKNKGFNISGFDIYMDSVIPRGAGVSSSAAYEVLIGKVISTLFNDDKISKFDLAEAAQFAENTFFGKKSGLLDQIAVAEGGLSLIDFQNPTQPTVRNIKFEDNDYEIIIVNPGGNHSKLTNLYDEVTKDMSKVAKVFKKKYLREISFSEFLVASPIIYQKVGGRAYLRANHFFEENIRVSKAVEAMAKKDLALLRRLIIASGRSSYDFLDNYTYPGDRTASLKTAYHLSIRRFHNGAFRVHGGGFAGTLLAFVLKEETSNYIKMIESFFGRKRAYIVQIRDEGATEVF